LPPEKEVLEKRGDCPVRKAIPRRTVRHYPGEWMKILSCLFGGRWITGGDVMALEAEFAKFIGVRHATAVSSATVGLETVLKSLEMMPGSEIILPAYTVASVPAALVSSGFHPVFADVDARDDNIAAETIGTLVTEKTSAVIVNHTYGRPCDMHSISAMAERFGFYIIEDFSQAVGAAYKTGKTGSFGTAGICSFAPTKNFNTFGGGMITTNDSDLFDKLRRRADAMPPLTHLQLAKSMAAAAAMDLLSSPNLFTASVFPVQRLMSLSQSDLLPLYRGTLYKIRQTQTSPARYANVQAVAGRKILQGLDASNCKRSENARLLDTLLDPAIPRPRDATDTTPIHLLFMIRTDNPLLFSRRLLRYGIDTGKFFMMNCGNAYCPEMKFPRTDIAVNKTLQIPVREDMAESDIHRIADAVNAVFHSMRANNTKAGN
jgi:dTDP-4-amino-4,6-dideoxygalactose transaminase